MPLKMDGLPKMPFTLYKTDDQDFVVHKLKDYQIPEAYNIFHYYANQSGEGYSTGEFGSLEYFKQHIFTNLTHKIAITEIKSGQLAFVATIAPTYFSRSTHCLLNGTYTAANPAFRKNHFMNKIMPIYCGYALEYGFIGTLARASTANKIHMTSRKITDMGECIYTGRIPASTNSMDSGWMDDLLVYKEYIPITNQVSRT